MEQKPIHPLLTLPSAIILAATIIAIAIIWTKKPIDSAPPVKTEEVAPKPEVPAITAVDHILGNPNAPIKIVEYSDTSCPFCRIFHKSMLSVMDQYGASGQVAWVYRHFPIYKDGTGSNGGALHPNAGKEAQALECAAELGGNDGFWKYTNRLYDITPSVTQTSPKGLDLAELPKIATFAGLNEKSFTECLESGRYAQKVDDQYNEALRLGIRGTPYSFLITKGQTVPIEGAQPLATVKQMIESAIRSR